MFYTFYIANTHTHFIRNHFEQVNHIGNSGAICRTPNIFEPKRVREPWTILRFIDKTLQFVFDFFITKIAFGVLFFCSKAIILFQKPDQTLSFADYTKFYVSYLLWKSPYFIFMSMCV